MGCSPGLSPLIRRGAQLIQEPIREGLHAVTPYEPKMEKIMRMHSVTSTMENGFVYLPEKAHWLADYLHELTTFPNGRFDDQCDSTSQALDWVKTGGDIDHFVRLYKSLAEKVESEIYGDHVGPCPFCRNRSISHEGSEVRCLNCGKRWDRPIRSHRVTRADMLNGRWRF